MENEREITEFSPQLELTPPTVPSAAFSLYEPQLEPTTTEPMQQMTPEIGSVPIVQISNTFLAKQMGLEISETVPDIDYTVQMPDLKGTGGERRTVFPQYTMLVTDSGPPEILQNFDSSVLNTSFPNFIPEYLSNQPTTLPTQESSVLAPIESEALAATIPRPSTAIINQSLSTSPSILNPAPIESVAATIPRLSIPPIDQSVYTIPSILNPARIESVAATIPRPSTTIPLVPNTVPIEIVPANVPWQSSPVINQPLPTIHSIPNTAHSENVAATISWSVPPTINQPLPTTPSIPDAGSIRIIATAVPWATNSVISQSLVTKPSLPNPLPHDLIPSAPKKSVVTLPPLPEISHNVDRNIPGESPNPLNVGTENISRKNSDMIDNDSGNDYTNENSPDISPRSLTDATPESNSAESVALSEDPVETAESLSDDALPETTEEIDDTPSTSEAGGEESEVTEEPIPLARKTGPVSMEGFPKFAPQIQKPVTLKPSVIAPLIPIMPAAESTVLFGFLGTKTVVTQEDPVIIAKADDTREEDDYPASLELITEQPSAKSLKKRWTRKHGLPGSLECLEHIDMLLIEKSTDTKIVVGVRKGEDMFLFKNRHGRVLFYAVEQPTCWSVNYCPSGRPFTMKVYDTKGEEVINFKRKMSCVAGCFVPCLWQSIITYCPPSCLLGTIEEDFTFCIPKFSVYNSSGAGIFTLRGPIGASICNQDIDFLVYQRDQYSDIGLISQSWPDEDLDIYKRDVYGIRFPIELDCKVKILLTAAATLINYIYYQIPKVPPQSDAVPVPEITL